MTPWQRSTFNVVTTAVFGVAFVLWTLFLPESLDTLWQVPTPPEQHWVGQIGAAIALIGLPAVIYPGLFVASWWASRRQLTSVSAALLLAVALGFGSATLLKELIGRDRPVAAWDHLISHQGPGYPAPHMVAVTTAVIMLATLVTVARRGRRTVRAWQVAGALLVVLFAANLLLMQAHRITDVVGGILLGAFVASAANLVCGVNAVRLTRSTTALGGSRAAVIYNPTKVLDQTVFKGLIERRLAEDGWEPPLWLSTSIDDPGGGMAQQALDAKVDLVMVAGGDGTVRVVCGALANTEAIVAIVPSGTGNLLAGNMKIPFDAERALDVALHGRTTSIDVLKVTVPGQEVDHAVVMCGVGADAAVLNDTNEDLKNQIGVAAYVIAGLNHVKARPFHAMVTVDEETLERDASLVMVGNVRDLQAGLTIMPEASASDGLMDLLIASPKNQVELTQMVSAVLAQSKEPATMDRRTGKRIHIELAEDELYELDGDVIGETTELTFDVLPAALRLRVPR